MDVRSLTDRIAFRSGARLPMIYQTEASECGLACLAMVANYYGHDFDLSSLRRELGTSLSGITLGHMVDQANQLGLTSRPLRLELDELDQLQLPAVLHWNFSHFVVLKRVSKKGLVIHDPAIGIRTVTRSEADTAFTGIALELMPGADFEPREAKQRISLRKLIGTVHGLKRTIVKLLTLAFALEVLSLALPFLTQWIIDGVLSTGDLSLLTLIGIGGIAIIALQQLLSLARAWFLIYIKTTVNLQWVSNVFTHMVRLPVEYFERRHLGDIVSRFGAIHQIQETLSSSFIVTVLDGVMSFALLAMMLLYSPLLTALTVGLVLVYTVLRLLWYRPLREASEKMVVSAAKQDSHFLETVRGVRSIKLFTRENERRANWLNLSVEQINSLVHVSKLNLAFEAINGSLNGLHMIAILWVGASLALDGYLSAGMLVAYVAYSNQFSAHITSLVNKMIELKMLGLQCERLSDIVLTEREDIGNPADIDLARISADIELVDVSYRYASTERDILQHCSLKLRAGESVALTGPSGCGKTTLLKLVLGILQPREGEVRVGGIPIHTLGLNNLRKLVATVMQDDQLFSGSIAENIAFFSKQVDWDWIHECARRAGIHDQILQMPMGYYTLVGDMGTTLSGGQKQRILLARALYKKPRIILLDEATSHLDTESEYVVNQAIRELNITRLIIAHRPETIRMAERVVEMREGRIVAPPEPSQTAAAEEAVTG